MKSNYKRIGKYIRLVDERNEQLKVKTLLGLSISKEFIPSVANIIGTDMANYKIIRKNQFACSTMQVRRDGKMPVALLRDFEEALISPAYPVFEIIDPEELLPDYLMMWMTRSEFDREACFYAIGGVRGSLEWEDFCDMQLPVPHPDKQRELVKEYNTIVNRINLNRQLIQKLEETAQVIYKQWFIDRSDVSKKPLVPLNQYVQTNPSLNLKKNNITTYVEMNDITTHSMGITGSIKRKYNGGSKFQNGDTLFARITPCLENGKTAFVDILSENEVAFGSTEFIVMRAVEKTSPYWVYCLARDDNFRSYAISSMIGSSGRQRVHEKYLEIFQVQKIDDNKMIDFHKKVEPIFLKIKNKARENRYLYQTQCLLLAKLAK